MATGVDNETELIQYAHNAVFFSILIPPSTRAGPSENKMPKN